MDYPQFLKGWDTVRELGSGGFGKVYEVKNVLNPDSARYHSALKVITIPPSGEAFSSYLDNGYTLEQAKSIISEQVSVIEKECQIMADLKGLTNIVSYEEHSIRPLQDGISQQILIRMELLTPLVQHLNAQPLTDQLVVSLGADICTALDRCMRRKLIHRDIKPQNIFINRDGDFKLGDFGIAKNMEQMTVATRIGTYHYMAPEVFHNQPYDHRVDIYSLGLVLYWILNERRMPFLPLPPAAPSSADFDKALSARIGGSALPAPKNGSDALKKVVLKACAFRPEDRYDSPAAFRKALELAGQSTFDGGATMPPPGYHPHPSAGTQTDASHSTSAEKKYGSTRRPTQPPIPDPPVDEAPEDNSCPWCFGRGGQVFVHSLKGNQHIAFRDTCWLCSGKGRVGNKILPLVKKQIKTLIRSNERWTADTSCECCRGRGWVYTADELPVVSTSADSAFLKRLIPCPKCAGHKVRFAFTGKQRKSFNSKLKRELLLKCAMIGFLLGILFLLEVAASSETSAIFSKEELAPVALLFLFWFIFYPIRFYSKYKTMRIVEKLPLKATLILSYFISLFAAVLTSALFSTFTMI